MARKPTYKQEKFAQAVASGMTLADAYREAYDCEKSSKETVRVHASRLAANATVAPLIEAEKARRDRGLQRNLGNRRRWILERLLDEAESEDGTAASRVKSLELLAKLAGMFDSEKEASEKRKHASETELEAELEQRLAEIIEKPVEVSAIDIDPDDVSAGEVPEDVEIVDLERGTPL